MPSEYSSLGSIEDARKLAKNLGIRFELLPIHDVFAQFQHVLEPLFAGTPFGLAEENLQSRIRGSAADGAVEQVRRAGADDGQQERDVDGVLHAVWRHGGRAGGDWRCDEDAGVCAEPVCEPASAR